jgi:hypothetical protein
MVNPFSTMIRRRTSPFRKHAAVCLAWLTIVGSGMAAERVAGGRADESTKDAEEFFEKQVRPLLIERCQKCHGSEKHESGLRLDSRDALLHGGDRGVAAVAGDAEGSLLIEAVRYMTEDLQMPPDGKLSAEQIKSLEHWVDSGLAWPDKRDGAAPGNAAVTSATASGG